MTRSEECRPLASLLTMLHSSTLSPIHHIPLKIPLPVKTGGPRLKLNRKLGIIKNSDTAQPAAGPQKGQIPISEARLILKMVIIGCSILY